MISITEIETEIADVESKIATLEANIESNATQQATRRTKLTLGKKILASLETTKAVILSVNDELGNI
jgi:hypothetical protein